MIRRVSVLCVLAIIILTAKHILCDDPSSNETPTSGKTNKGKKTTTAPSIDVKKNGYLWILMNYKSYTHKINVLANGKQLGSFTSEGGGIETRPFPFKEGKNTVLVSFTPRPNITVWTGAYLKLMLCKKKLPQEKVFEIGETAIIHGQGEDEWTFWLKDGKLGKYNLTIQRWCEKDKKNIFFKNILEGNILLESADKENMSAWYAGGKLRYNEEWEKDKLVNGKYYKPDGTLGAEVKDGKGVRVEWNGQGMLLEEAQYKDGEVEGEVKNYYKGELVSITNYISGEAMGKYIYYDNGKICMKGQYKNGLKDGFWIVYKDNGEVQSQATYSKGEKISNKKMP